MALARGSFKRGSTVIMTELCVCMVASQSPDILVTRGQTEDHCESVSSALVSNRRRGSGGI